MECPSLSKLAAAAVVVAATAAAQIAAAAVAVAVAIAAAAQQKDQNDDPPAAIATPETVTVTHNRYLRIKICYGLRRTHHTIPEARKGYSLIPADLHRRR